MNIQRVAIQHFRSIQGATLECDSLTALIGANGAGKSSFLRALELFYAPQAMIDSHDFYAGDTSQPIQITVTFGALSEKAQTVFAPFCEAGALTVTKQIEQERGGKKRFAQQYFGYTLQHARFQVLRNDRLVAERLRDYNRLRRDPTYSDLPAVSTDRAMRAALAAWEAAHPSACERLPSAYPFFGSKELTEAKLERFTNFLLVPAVRDIAADGTDERGSVINRLIDIVLRQFLTENPAVQRLQADAEHKLRQIRDLTDLASLNTDLNTSMQRLTRNTEIKLGWADTNVKLPMPQVQVQLSEDGYPTPIDRTGHGVQRAFILTLLQHLAVTNRPDSEQDASSSQPATPDANLVLAIEEPELFQHPVRQRHFAAILDDLANGSIAGVASHTQVLYCTHSPYFVDIDRFDQVRLIRKQNTSDGLPKKTTVFATSTEAITNLQPNLTHAKLASALTGAINEGFFAQIVVLVEGEGDRAMLHAVARYCMQQSLEAYGVAVLSVDGKPKMIKPLLIFKQLGIKTYVIWDSDAQHQGTKQEPHTAKHNRELLRLCDAPEEDWPDGIFATHAAFAQRLEEIIQHDAQAAGLDLAALTALVKDEIGEDSLKNASVMQRLVQLAAEQGRSFPTIIRVIEHILNNAPKEHAA